MARQDHVMMLVLEAAGARARIRALAMAFEAAGARVTVVVPTAFGTFGPVGNLAVRSVSWEAPPPPVLEAPVEQAEAEPAAVPEVLARLRRHEQAVARARRALGDRPPDGVEVSAMAAVAGPAADAGKAGMPVAQGRRALDPAAARALARLRAHERSIERARLELALGGGDPPQHRRTGRRLQRGILRRRDTETEAQPAAWSLLASAVGRVVPRQGDPDAEVAVGPVLDRLAPDAVHAFDVTALAVALDARVRAHARGRSMLVGADLDHVARDDGRPSLRRRIARERDLRILEAARLTTASPAALEALGGSSPLAERTAVVLDAPLFVGSAAAPKALRRLAADPAGLVAYAPDETAPEAGAQIVRAAAAVAGHHVVLVRDPGSPWATALGARSAKARVGDRVHVVELPDPDLLTAYLALARAYVVDSASVPGDPRALAALTARVPLIAPVGSWAGDLVGRMGIGMLYDPDVPGSVGAALGLGRTEEHARAYADASGRLAAFDWRAQAETTARALKQAGGPDLCVPRPRAARGDSSVRLGIGPRNGNGMAWAWMRALRDIRPDIATEVFAAEYDTGSLDMRFPSDVGIRIADWKSREWQLWWSRHVLIRYSHLLIEQGLSACGWLNGKFFNGDAPMLRRHGIELGLVFRGSEIRDPAAHARRNRWSPFDDPAHPLTAKLQKHVGTLRPLVDAFDGPLFVTTLDLLDDLPRATWLPHVIDLDFWSPGPPVFQRDVPVVLHAPSREKMKGSSFVDEVCRPLADAGVIVYDRLHGVPFSEMPDRIRAADVVIDQLALGAYGVLAAQALATRRIVVGHVAPHIRARIPEGLPIVEAEPDRLGYVLGELLAGRHGMQAVADAGRTYVETHHDGRRSAAALSAFIDRGAVPPA